MGDGRRGSYARAAMGVPSILALIVLVAPAHVPSGLPDLAPSVSQIGDLGAPAARLLAHGMTSPGSYEVFPLENSGPGGEPSVAVNRYGTLLVGWMNWSGPLSTSPPGINEYAVSTDRGRSFTAARTLPVSIQRYESDVAIASGTANGSFWLGYQSQPTSCSASSSGVTVTAAWNNASELSEPALSMACASNQYYDREWLGSTPNGTIFQVADMPVGPSAPDLFVARSFDGVHFHAAQVVANDSYVAIGASAYNDSLWAIGDTDYPAKQCVLYLSRDGGATWSPTTAQLPSNCSSGVDPAAGLRGTEWQFGWSAGGELIVTYETATGIEVVRSSDLGATWSTPQIVSGGVPSGTQFQTPTIATNQTSGTVAIAWLDTRTGNTTWQAYLASSTDDGITWTGPEAISVGPVGSGAKFWPGDFLGSTMTPWGTDAVVWGGESSTGELVPWIAQVPISSFVITFSEVGLPGGTPWSVTLNGARLASSSSVISFREPDGEYTYGIGPLPGYVPAPTAGTFRVDGSPVSVPIAFSPFVEALEFTESGLPRGKTWSVHLNGTAERSSTTSVILFSVPNGSYSYTVDGPPAYRSSPEAGPALITGHAVEIMIRFAPLPPPVYNVTFFEAGLPSSTDWSVTLNGTALTTDAPFIKFGVTNGSYPYSIATTSHGFLANVTSGRIMVAGSNASIRIGFAIRVAPGGSPIDWSSVYSVGGIAGATIGVGATVVYVVLARRRQARSRTDRPKRP